MSPGQGKLRRFVTLNATAWIFRLFPFVASAFHRVGSAQGDCPHSCATWADKLTVISSLCAPIYVTASSQAIYANDIVDESPPAGELCGFGGRRLVLLGDQ